MTESYRADSSKKPYYHWLERAQLGLLESVVLRWPALTQENIFRNISFDEEFLGAHATTFWDSKSYSYTDNRHKSSLFELAEGHRYVPNQGFIRELSQAVTFHLKNENHFSISEATQVDLNPALPREINPLFIEKKYDFRQNRENKKLLALAQTLGASPQSPNEMLFCFVILDLIENLIILKDKFPQLKIYLRLPKGKFQLGIDAPIQDQVIEIEDVEFRPSTQKNYFIHVVKETHQPFLGLFFLTDKVELTPDQKREKILLNNSTYIYASKKLLLVPPAPGTQKSLSVEGLLVDYERTEEGIKIPGHAKLGLLKELFNEDKKLIFESEPVKPLGYGLSYQNGTGLEHYGASISFWTEFELNEKKYRVHNFHNAQDHLVKFILQGIGYFSTVERKELASFRKGVKRDHDLKILKHQGVAALIVAEVCHHALKLPLTSGEVDLDEGQLIAAIEKNIFNLFRKAIFLDKYGETVLPRTSLKDYISDNVYDFLMETIEMALYYVEQEDRYVILDGKILNLTNQRVFTASALLAVIEPIISFTRGDVFTKGSSKYFEQLTTRFTDNEIYEPIFVDTDIELELRNQHVLRLAVSDAMVPFLFSKMTELSGDGWDILIDNIPIEKLGEEDFQSEIVLQNGKTDWFELSPKIFFKGMQIRIEDIKFSNTGSGSKVGNGIIFFRGRPYIIDPKSLPKYSLLEKFWERIKKEASIPTGSKEREFVRVPRSHILELLSLAESGTKIITDNPYWAEIYNFYKNLGSPGHHVRWPPHLKNVLKDYQETGSQWIYDLYRLQLGGILADDMGLGKTLQALTFFNQHKIEGHQTWSLIIVPTSLCFNWQNEAKKFTPDLDVEIFTPTKKLIYQSQKHERHKILIVTYGLLLEHEDFFAEFNWDIVIFDEAQNLKNLSSKRASSARSLKAKFKLALSGTPLENNYLDFFSLTDLVLPGSLGTYKSFSEIFGAGKTIESEDLTHLKQKMKPIVLRRTKSSVNLNLPTKTEESCRLEFTPEQLELYKKLALSHNDQVTELIKENGAASSQIAMLTALLRLRQVCSDPNGIPNVKFNGVPPKLSYLTDCVTEHLENGKSVLIFTQFLATLESLSKMFVKNGILFSTIHGAVSSKNRSLVLDKFQNSDQPQVLLMTLKTGGVGLNLTKASVVYHVEPWWNPAVENQATDRVHRLGQKNDIEVFRLIMKDSVEEKIELLKLKKKSYFDSLFSQDETSSVGAGDHAVGSNYLSADDFKFLLS